MSDEPFTLRNDPPDQAKAEFENNDCRQRLLFAGLNCLPGQIDVFVTDGEEPAELVKHKPAIVPWDEAQSGDRVARGWLLFMRRLYLKSEAKRIAAEEGGRVRPDGRVCWAVIVPELDKPVRDERTF
jgi:hypothetical protein